MSDNPTSNNQIKLVHALNINLFAYYAKVAKKDNLSEVDNTPEKFQTIYQPILEKLRPQFTNSELTNSEQLSDQLFAHQLTVPPTDQPKQPIQSLLRDQEFREQEFLAWSSHQQNNHPQQPQPLYKLSLRCKILNSGDTGDTYALLLKLYRPQQNSYDQVLVEEFNEFQPSSFILPHSESFIGQTILVTAFLAESTDTKPDNLRKIADFLREKLFGDQLPNFYQDGYLLDSYICEYSQPRQKSDRLLIILYLQEATTEKIAPIFPRLLELFMPYHKILYTFQSSRIWHKQANQLVKGIENTLKTNIKTIQATNQKVTNQNITANLNILNTTLENLLQNAFDYSLELRKLEYGLNTINIHRQNYQTILQDFQNITHDQLNFLALFLENQFFTSQIEADLNYLKPTSNLLDQAINSIRGIVEIEQANIDIAKTESDRSLEKTIKILGVGLGVGGIVSSTISGYIQEPISFTPNFSKPIHPGVFSLLISLLLGILAALGMAGFIYRSYLLEKIKKIFN